MNDISQITPKYEHQTLLNETTDKPRADLRGYQTTDNATDLARNDKVSLSQASREMQLAKDAVAQSPDVREEKIAELKQAIASNQYAIPPDKVAESVVGSIISEVL